MFMGNIHFLPNRAISKTIKRNVYVFLNIYAHEKNILTPALLFENHGILLY